MIKIALFGKNGQVGSEISAQAKAFGFQLIAFGREEIDITNAQAVTDIIKKHKPQIIINASAYHVVPDCEAFPEIAFAINTIAVKHLADIAESNHSRFVHFSTDYVFDGLKGKPYKEDDKPNPLQVYGISKLAGEYAALRYCQRSIVIRGAYIYGGKEGSRSKKGNFVLTMLKQSEGKDTLEVASDQLVSPTYAADLAKATLQLLQQKDAQGIYHLANQGYCSLAEFAQAIIKAKGRKTKIIPVERGGGTGMLHRPLFSALRNTRAKKQGIILPKWQDGIKRYVKSLE